MRKENGRGLRRSLMPVVMICLSSCAAEYCSPVMPVYPVAGEKVAAELENIPYSGYEDFWEWLARVDKLRQELSSF